MAKGIEFVKNWKASSLFVVPKEIEEAYPDMHFVFANREDELRISRFLGKGYEVVKVPERFKNKIKSYKTKISGTPIDDCYYMGDTILMMCPKEQYEQRELQKEQFIKNMSSSSGANIEQEAMKVGSEIGSKIPTDGQLSKKRETK